MKKVLFIVSFVFLLVLFFFITHYKKLPEKNASITIAFNQKKYLQQDSIKISVTNASSETIYFKSHHTNCSVIKLERLIDKNWQEENPCALLGQIVTFSLKSKQHISLPLDPLPSGWVKGTYRALITAYYQSAQNKPFSAHSSTFIVQ